MSEVEELKEQILRELKEHLKKEYVTREELTGLIGKIEAFSTQYAEVKALVIDARNDINNLGGKVETDFSCLTTSINNFTETITNSVRDVEKEAKKGLLVRLFDNSPKFIKFVITFAGMWLIWILGTSFLPDFGNNFMNQYGLWVMLFNTMVAGLNSRLNR